MATWQMFYFQNSNSPYSDHLVAFHNLVMVILVMILIMIVMFMVNLVMNTFLNRFLLKNHTIEMVWTILPMLILVFICFPSLKVLYFIDEVLNPIFSIKAVGHQWYWSYEYSDLLDVEFDSYMLISKELNLFRLLDVDNRMIVPIKFAVRLVVTSIDVIHSWAVPSLGAKVDAIPGRINQFNLLCFRPGLFFGQCSEICGMNHSFMPIVLESTSLINFLEWLKDIYYKML